MAENSKIEWTDHTFNPWEGCQRIGPGCDHCYAETRNARFGGGVAVNWGSGAPRRRTSAANWNKPLRWQAEAAAFFAVHGRRQRVFCASLADVFDNAVDPQWRADLFNLIDATPDLDWLLLTKRIGNVYGMVRAAGRVRLPEHVILGVTVVTQPECDRDGEKLNKLKASGFATRTFFSMEPLLGPIIVPEHILYLPCENWLDEDGYPPTMDPSTGMRECCSRCDFTGIGTELAIDGIIVGGESGPGARPMHPNWARSLRDQCAAAGVPFLLKQWGEWLPGHQYESAPAAAAADPDLEQSRFACMDWDGDTPEESGGGWTDDLGEHAVFRVGKRRAGRLLDGVQHDGLPG